MTRKFIAPDSGVKEVNVEGARTGITERISRDHKGFFTTESARHAKALKSEGFVEASLMGTTTDGNLGYLCGSCGFAGWFNLCGRCGETAMRVGQ